MVSLDPEISNLLWVRVSSEVSSGSGCASTFPNVRKKKWKTLDIQNGSKNWISNSTFFGITISDRFIVRDGILSVADYNLTRVGVVVVVVVVVCPPFLKSFTMGFLLNALSYKVEIWYGALAWWSSMKFPQELKSHHPYPLKTPKNPPKTPLNT